MNYKKIAILGLSFLAIALCSVGIILATKHVVTNSNEIAMTDVFMTKSEALSRYKSSLEKHNELIAKQRAEQEKLISETNSTNTPEADTEGDPNLIITDDNDIDVYMIQKGDTLSEISAKVFYSVDELANYNEIRNVNLIYANSALRIPDLGTSDLDVSESDD